MEWLSKRLNLYCHEEIIVLNGSPLAVQWTKRAEHQLRTTQQPLIAEMQLYFTCVVKKRVLFHKLNHKLNHELNHELFHETFPEQTTKVSQTLSVIFRPVEASSCDPEEFAKNYPEKRKLTSTAASKMKPKYLHIDFKNGMWSGEFGI